MIKCPECEGSGELGVIIPDQSSYYGFGDYEVICTTCKGAGKIEEEPTNAD